MRLSGRWTRLVAILVLAAFLPACQVAPAQIYIPLAYGVTGLCIAVLVSPSLISALVGLSIGVLIGAAVYNNSLKANLIQKSRYPAPVVPVRGQS